MTDHYVFATKPEAQACLDFINSTPWFPMSGMVSGAPAPEGYTKTTKWWDTPNELITGEWAIPRIPETRLDYAQVPKANRDGFMDAFGQDIRALSSDDFHPVEV